MKSFLICSCLLLGITLQGLPSPLVAETLEIFVSPKGKDSNNGTRNAPLKSLDQARKQARLLRSSNPQKPIRIYVGGGIYSMENPLILSAEDSGAESAPITYEALEGENPVFTGSQKLKKWKVVKDASVLAQLDPAAKGKVFVTSLREIGVADFGDATDLGLRPELFCNEQLQTLARWPNSGFIKSGQVRGKTALPPTYLAKRGSVEGDFEYIHQRQNRWAKEKDPRLAGYWYWDWSEQFQKVDNIDTLSHTIHIREPYHNYGYKDSLRYYGLNLLCELDIPNEWYLDRTSGLLYWYPPVGIDPSKADVVLSIFNHPYMVELKNCSYVTFKGLSFIESRGSAFQIENGKNCLISDCRMERFGRDGIHINQGEGHGVSGCLLRTLGCSGITLTGGDRKTLTPSGHFVENTVVEYFSLFKRTYQPAIHITGCGYRISNNRFRYSSSSAFRLEGNDILLEYNQISFVVNESDDQGGLDIFYNPSYRGIVVKYNYWSDIAGGTHHGAAGVRLDDMISGVVIYGNVFERCGSSAFGGVQIHGGKDNSIENNAFFNCLAAFSISSWGQKRWLEVLDSPVIQKKIFEEVDIRSPLYQEKYPDLKNIRLNADVNTYKNNLAVDCKNLFLRKNKVQIDENNTTISANGQTMATILSPDYLKKYGLQPIPYAQMGPRNNRWIKE